MHLREVGEENEVHPSHFFYDTQKAFEPLHYYRLRREGIRKELQALFKILYSFVILMFYVPSASKCKCLLRNAFRSQYVSTCVRIKHGTIRECSGPRNHLLGLNIPPIIP